MLNYLKGVKMKKVLTSIFVIFSMVMLMACQKDDQNGNKRANPPCKKDGTCPRKKCCSSVVPAKEEQSVKEVSSEEDAIIDTQEDAITSDDVTSDELDAQDEEFSTEINVAEIQKENIDLDNISDNTLELLEFKEVQENPDSLEN